MTLFWIIAGIALLVWAFIIYINADGFWFTLSFPGLIGGAATATGMFIVMLIATMLGFGIGGYHWTYLNAPLVALTDERSSTGGSFFLGTGVIGTNASYVFYVAGEGDAKAMQQVDAYGVLVYEDSTTPYARYRECKVAEHPAWVPLPSIDDHCDRPKLVELHVPPQSIKTGINLGVQQR